jgi:hypothetical protein
MKTGVVIAIFILVCFLLFLLINFIIWWKVSREHYTYSLHSGTKYTIDNRDYVVPNLLLKGDARLLSEPYLVNQRKLLINITKMFKEFKMEYWISGGTLLGFTRHKTFIPWDDDVDVHTHWKYIDYMFSSKFARDINKFGLEAIFLVGSSTTTATKQGAAVRIRGINTLIPVCDIFFVKEKSHDVFAKVDSWHRDNVYFNTNEVWHKDQLFPIKETIVDEMTLMFPNKPIDTLKKQYGDNVMDVMYARNVLWSHSYPFSQLNFVWTTH